MSVHCLRRDRGSRLVVFAALIAVLIVARAGSGPMQAQEPSRAGAAPAGDADNGRKIYTRYGCWQCHGFEAQGGAGARLAPNVWAFPAFAQYVRAPRAQMPGYSSKVLKDSEIADIYTFLLTIREPPTRKEIPLLDIK
jgi:mono/diheme cytochrome c family protein